MKRIVQVGCVLALAVAGVARAEDYVGSGWVNVPSAAWFSAYSSILFGEGYFNYQGSDVTFAGAFAVNPSGARKVATVAVPAGATLTLGAGGQVVQKGALVKTGRGTLAFGGATVSFKSSTAPDFGTAPHPLAWDAQTGGLTDGLVGNGLNVHEGAVSIADATVDFGTMVRVGSMGSANDASLTLDNARIRTVDSIAIGSCATNPAGATPVTRFTAKNSVFEAVGGMTVGVPTSNSYGGTQILTSEVTLDNCIVTNVGMLKMDTVASSTSTHKTLTTVTLTNGTLFINKQDTGGVCGGANVSETHTRFNVVGNSTLLVDTFGMDTYWKAGAASNVVTVGSGSTLGFLRTVSENSGTRWSWLHLDGGTLRPWTKYAITEKSFQKCAALLFHRWDNAYVLSGGATLYAPAHFYAYLFPALFEHPVSTGGSITVSGGGAFALSPTDVPISVRDGSTLVFTPRHFLNEDFGLDMNGDHLEYDPLIRNKSITVEDGASIRVLGLNQALMDMTLPAARISFSANGGNEALSSKLGIGRRKWVRSAASTRLYDGDGSMTVMDGTVTGNDGAHVIASACPLDLTRSFRITLEYSNAAYCDRVVKGVVAYIHNDSRGAAACGSGDFGLSYTTNATSSAKIDKSVGVMLRTWHTPLGLTFCKNGLSDASTLQTLPGSISYEIQPDRLRPLVFTLAYDAAKKKFSYAVTSPYGEIYGGSGRDMHAYTVGNTVDVDLSSVCGAQGYFGFSAGADGGSPIQHQIANVSIKYLDELTRPCADVAGRLSLADGTAHLSAYGTDTTAGYAMRELQFANGGTLDIATTNLAAGVDDPSFVAFDRWTGSGAVTKTGAGNLGLRHQSATNATLNLAEGGLVLRRDYEDPYVFDGDSITNRDWVGVQWGDNRNTAIYENDNTVFSGSGDTGRSGSTALKRLLKVSGAWQMAFDYESQQSDGAYGMFLTFHNDPRGYAAASGRGVSEREYNEQHALIGASTANSIKRCAAIEFYNYADNEVYTNECHKIKWWQSDATGAFSASGTVLSKTQPDSSGNEQIYIANYARKPKTGETLIKVARKFHCVIDYDDALAKPLKITLTQTQGADGTEGAERKWSMSFANKIHEAVGEDLCNFGLFFCSGGQTTRVKVKNFVFRHTDATESAAKPYFGTVNVTASDAKVYLDGTNACAYTLAKTVNLAGALTVRSLRTAGVLDLGAVGMAPKSTLAADGATVRVASAAGIDPRARFAVRNGGRLNLDFDGALQVSQIEIDGQVIRRGLVSAETSEAIAGKGRLVVGRGFQVIVR